MQSASTNVQHTLQPTQHWRSKAICSDEEKCVAVCHSVLQCVAVWCCVVQCGAVYRSALRCVVVFYNEGSQRVCVVRRCEAPRPLTKNKCNTLQHTTQHCNILLHYTTQQQTAHYNTLQNAMAVTGVGVRRQCQAPQPLTKNRKSADISGRRGRYAYKGCHLNQCQTKHARDVYKYSKHQ